VLARVDGREARGLERSNFVRKAASGTILAFWSLQQRRGACLAAALAMQTGTVLRGASRSLAVAERPPGIPRGGSTFCTA